MKRKYIQDYQMLTKVVDYTGNIIGLFPKTSAASEILAELSSAVIQLSEQARTQVSSEAAMRVSRRARTVARNNLKKRLVLSDRIAQVLNSDHFRAPEKHGDRALIDSGRAFVVDMEPLKKDFTWHGLPPEEMTSAVEALERANLDYTSGLAMRASSIEQFGAIIAAAMVQLKRLDVLVAMTLTDNPTAMASWTVARSTNRVAVRKPIEKPPHPPAPSEPVNTPVIIAEAA
jgi:hypothetical protein